MSSSPTAYVIDDEEAVRTAIARLLRSANFDVRVFASAQEFIEAFDADRPGCLILDVQLPKMNGLQLQETLRQRQIEVPIIMISGQGDIACAVRAMKGGAVDYLEKPFGEEQLLDCVRKALARDAENRALKAKRAAFQTHLTRLTPRERDVYERLVAGERVDQVALRLGLSPKTVYIHREHILKKMGVDSLPELIRLDNIDRPRESESV